MTVLVERRAAVAVVTLVRPDKRNAFDASMTQSLDAALNEVDDDPEVRAVVLAAEGAAFSAGTDLASGSGGPTPRGGPYGITARRRSTPVIAAVEGPAVGGGFEIVLACDLVVASTTAYFALPEVSRGVVATCGALFRAPRTMSPNQALELLLTGDPITAQRGYELGVVNRVVEPGGAVSEAIALASRIAEHSPTAITATLRAVRAMLSLQDETGWSWTEVAARSVLASPDSAEGKAAFLEKRAPRWNAPSQ